MSSNLALYRKGYFPKVVSLALDAIYFTCQCQKAISFTKKKNLYFFYLRNIIHKQWVILIIFLEKKEFWAGTNVSTLKQVVLAEQF